MDKHINNDELNALVPWSAEDSEELHGLSPDAIREAGRHAKSCVDCSKKVAKYRQLSDRFSNVAVSGAAPPRADCPKDIDWFDVAFGLWPESRARQLIMHAALCDHCGPLLRKATSLALTPTPQEEKLLAELKAPSQPDIIPEPVPPPPPPWRFMRWLVPALALMLIVAALGWWLQRPLSGAKFAEFAVSTYSQLVAALPHNWLPSSSRPLPGAKFAEFAVSTYSQHAQ